MFLYGGYVLLLTRGAPLTPHGNRADGRVQLERVRECRRARTADVVDCGRANTHTHTHTHTHTSQCPNT